MWEMINIDKLEKYWNVVVPRNLAENEYVRILAKRSSKLTPKQQEQVSLGISTESDFNFPSKSFYIKTCVELKEILYNSK